MHVSASTRASLPFQMTVGLEAFPSIHRVEVSQIPNCLAIEINLESSGLAVMVEWRRLSNDSTLNDGSDIGHCQCSTESFLQLIAEVIISYVTDIKNDRQGNRNRMLAASVAVLAEGVVEGLVSDFG